MRHCARRPPEEASRGGSTVRTHPLVAPPSVACDLRRGWRRPHIAAISCSWLRTDAEGLADEADEPSADATDVAGPEPDPPSPPSPTLLSARLRTVLLRLTQKPTRRTV